MKKKVIACVVIKNDQKFIPDLVKSLRDQVDGLIVLANHDSQNTSIKPIFDHCCILNNVPLLDFMFDEKSNMAALRNKLILSSRKFGESYLLMIDADERINCFGTTPLLKVNLDKQVYDVPIHSCHSYIDDDSRFTESRQKRLFVNCPELFYEHEYHETLNTKHVKSVAVADFLHITHFGYDLTKEELHKKGTERIHRILTPDNFKSDTAKALINFAETIDVMGNSSVASEIYSSILTNFDKIPGVTRSYIASKLISSKRHGI